MVNLKADRMDIRNKSMAPLSVLALAAVILASLCGLFAVHTSTTALEFPRFLVAVILFFLLPGNLVIRLLGLQMTTLEHCTLALSLGLVTTSVFYMIFAWLQIPWLLWGWWGAACWAFVAEYRRVLERLGSSISAANTQHALLLLALVGGWLPMYFLDFYFPNWSWSAEGQFDFVTVADNLLHTSLAAELTHTVLPQVPFMAGEPLNYHIGMDIVTALTNRFGGVAIPDMVVRYCPALFITLIVLSAYCLIRRFTGSGGAGVAGALLITLGEDLSFIPGMLQQSGEIWSAYYFRSAAVFSLYFFNAIVAALGLFLTGLYCLYRSLEDKVWSWSLAAALCIAALIQTKIFIFMHFAVALALATAIHFLVFRRTLLLRQALVIFAVSLPLMLVTLGRNDSRIIWIWSSGFENYVIPAFKAAQWPLLVNYPILGLMVYLILTNGFRLLGGVELIRSLRPSDDKPLHFVLAIFVVLGPVLTLTSKIVPRDDLDVYNNSIWFLITSKYVAVLFAIMALLKLWRSMVPAWRVLLVVMVAVISLPSTIQYVLKSPVLTGKTTGITNMEMKVIEFLNQEAKAGEVVFSRIDGPVLALTKLHIPFAGIYPKSFAVSGQVNIRFGDMRNFWQSWQRGEIREDLLAKYHAGWIVATQSNGELSEWQSIDLGALRLQRAFSNSNYIVFKVLPKLN